MLRRYFPTACLHALLPQIPDAVDDGEIDRVGFRAFLGAEIGDLGAEPDRLGLQACVDVGVIGAEYGDLDVRSDGDVAVASHQHDRLVAERPRQRLADAAVAHQHVGLAELPCDVPDRHAGREEAGVVEQRAQGCLADRERDHAGRMRVHDRHHVGPRP